MKKVFALTLAVLLTAVLAVPAVATSVKSPTQDGLPYIEVLPDFYDENGKPVVGCQVRLMITADQRKDDLTVPEVIRKSLHCANDSYSKEYNFDARAMLIDADPTGNWSMQYPGWELTVTNIFDITLLCDKAEHNAANYAGLLEYHDPHHVSMKLSDEDIRDFVALLHYYNPDHTYDTTDEAHWELIETTRGAGNEILFSLQCSNLSPFALVVKTRSDNSNNILNKIIGTGIIAGILGKGDNGGGCSDGGNGGGTDSGEPTSPQTGEIDNSAYWLPCGIFFAAVGVTAIYRGKKEKQYVR